MGVAGKLEKRNLFFLSLFKHSFGRDRGASEIHTRYLPTVGNFDEQYLATSRAYNK